MPTKKVSFATVRKIGLALPDVEEGTVYGGRKQSVGRVSAAKRSTKRS
jgi:hypothetical protein